MAGVIQGLRYEREKRLKSAHGAQSNISTLKGELQRLDGQIADNQGVLKEREIDIKNLSDVTKRYKELHLKNEEAISFQNNVLARLRHIDEVFVDSDVNQIFNEVT